MSGVVAPPERTGGEKISDMLDRQMNSAVLVVHGDRDSAVPVGAARNIVSRLRNLGVDVKYIEVPGAGHGNYDVGGELLTWIRNLFASEK
jgi:pimeloyl-ACP methyl ester carboxylesterase